MSEAKGWVIAGNHRQYQDWCQRQGFDPRSYRYIADERALMGAREAPICIGTYASRSDWPMLLDIVNRLRKGSTWDEPPANP